MQIESKDGRYKVVCGVLPRDAEYQTVGAKATPLCKFSVKADENTETQSVTWQNCIVWFEKASYAALFKKGDTVVAFGKVETHEYTKRDGDKGVSNELNVEFCMKMPIGFTIDNDCGGLPD